MFGIASKANNLTMEEQQLVEEMMNKKLTYIESLEEDMAEYFMYKLFFAPDIREQ